MPLTQERVATDLCVGIEPLSRPVSVRTRAAALVTIASGAHVQPPLLLRATSVAVNMSGIALAADAYRDPAAPAVISPERALEHRNAILF